MENRICQLLGIRYPIIQGGMVWISGSKLAAAVSNGGGLGLIGNGSMSPELLREHIRKCKALTDKPFGVNVPLMFSKVDDAFRIMEEEQVKIIFTSAGNPATYTPMLKEKGFTVVHVVSSLKFALKAQAAGVDAVVAEGFEAGGHNGREETTTLCLVPNVAQGVSIPVIAAGGIATGRGILAVMALGAKGVQIGSLFAVAQESSAHDLFKQKVIETGEGETLLTLKELAPTRLIKNKFYEELGELYKSCPTTEQIRDLLGKGRARKGIFEGDLDQGELEIGQIASLINQSTSAAQMIHELVNEYEQAIKSLPSSL